MNQARKVTESVRRRVFRLKAEGKSLRATQTLLEAEGVKLSVQGIADVLKGPEPKAGGDGTGRGTGSAGGQVRAGAGAGSGEGSGEGVGAEEEPITAPPDDASPFARNLYASLRETRRRMAEIPRDDEKTYASAYASLLRAYTAQLKDYHEALPKPPPDPSKDPHTIAARAMILQRVTSTIEAVKERARKAGYRFPGDPS